jgi:hypothetical protein
MAGSNLSAKRRTAAPDPWGAVWERLGAAAPSLLGEVAADRERAPVLLAELLAEPPSVRERMAVSLDRFRSPALAVLLVEQSLERKAAGGELAELALSLLGVIDDVRRRGVVEQAKARACGALANARRLQGDLAGAERALHRAAYHVAVAPDPLEEAWFYRLRARLRRDQGRLGRAVALQMQAVERLAATARPHLVAEALVELAALHLAAADRPRTLAALLAAASALGEGSECLTDCALGGAAGHEG